MVHHQAQMGLSKRIALGLAIAMAGMLATFSTTTPAHAAGRDGNCDSGEFCYFFFMVATQHLSAVSDHTGSLSNYGSSQPDCYEFKDDGNHWPGTGECIKNNANSVWNRSSRTVRVYFNSYYSGTYQDIASGAKVNLNSQIINNNASHKFL